MNDYLSAIAEAARVSSKWILLHRLQLTTGPTNEFLNPAYGTKLPTREINDAELMKDCKVFGLTLKDQIVWGGLKQWNASWLFEKSA